MSKAGKPGRARKPPRRTEPAGKAAGKPQARLAGTPAGEQGTDATNTAATNTAALLTAAREALELYLEVQVDDDGALSFRHSGVPGAVQAVQLAEGLVMLSLTCVVAWDVPVPREGEPDLAARLAMRAGEGLFGTLGVVRTESGYDVTLRYAFPAAGLDQAALGTLLMLVISTASQLRGELLDSPDA